MSKETVCPDNGFLKNIDEFRTLSTDCKRKFFTDASSYCNSNSREKFDDELWNKIRCLALEAMDDESPDVRRTAGIFLGDLSRIFKADVYGKSKSHILNKIEFLLKLDAKSQEIDPKETNKRIIEDHSLSNVIKNVSSHKHLDSWICCLDNIVVETGEEFCKEVDAVLLNLIHYCLEKKDMYLEQDCLKLIHSLLRCCKLYSYLTNMLNTATDQFVSNNFKEIEGQILSILLIGMFSQYFGVRYQSCKAIKEIFSSSDNLRMASKLLPAIWFNRYSKENGLQQLCQETWVELTKGQGKSIIETHFITALGYCFQKLNGELAGDRINSCHCLSEIIRKLDRKLVEPRIKEIYAHLKSILMNDSVDGQLTEDACLLLADMISEYPEQIESNLDELMQIMTDKLKGHSSSNVMDISAMVLSKVVKHYGQERSHLQELLNGILNHYQDFIASAKEPSNQTSAQSGVKSSSSLNVFLIKRKLQGAAHEIKPIISHQYQNMSVDQVYGQFCLLLHLLSILPQDYSAELNHLISQTWSVLSTMERSRMLDLATLFLSRVPEFLETMPKMKRKQQVDQFLEISVRLAKQSQKVRDAAVSLAIKLGRTFGRNIIRSKLSSLDEEFVKEFDEKSS